MSVKGEKDETVLAKGRWVFYGFLAIVIALLAFEHRIHLWGILPYLALLLCPLMHLFMHRHHGKNGGPSPGGTQNG